MKKRQNDLTVAVLTRNAAETLEKTLESVTFSDSILVIDQYSEDKTVDIAMQFTERIISSSASSFAKRRNIALKHCKTSWLLYIDSDEVVTSELQNEIRMIVKRNIPGVYAVTRENYFLGNKMYPDTVERLFHTDLLRGWQGDVHESAIFPGESMLLANALIHNTHRTIGQMLEKTNEWSEIEAELRIKTQHPPIASWRLIRVALTEFWHQLVRIKVWKYGREGWFEGYFQVLNSLIVYTKVWERQHVKPESIEKKT